MNIDDLKILELEENPQLLEQVYIRLQQMSQQDESVKRLLESIYYEEDRNSAFNRFLQSKEFQVILELLDIFRVDKNMQLCEIGGGPGFLTWALSQRGFSSVDLLEPNDCFNTGTGYLQSRDDTSSIQAYSDLKKFYSSDKKYDVILTKNCIHHFQNIAMTAAMIRKKMKPGSLWFSLREWFADTPKELYERLLQHPISQKYNMYEWPYPAHHYVESIEIAGFKMIAIVPDEYANNSLGTYSEGEWPSEIREFTSKINAMLQSEAHTTVEYFWKEVYDNKFTKHKKHLYTRPQMLLYQRIEID